MREILFRGKSITGIWEYGYYVFSPKITRASGQVVKSTDFDTHHIVTKKFNAAREINPKTLGQYTGLSDKNGKKIFEGDIVKVDGFIPTVSGIYEVIYDEVNHCYALERDIQYHFHYFTFSDLNGFRETSEVIGNIHDNPELLKEGAE